MKNRTWMAWTMRIVVGFSSFAMAQVKDMSWTAGINWAGAEFAGGVLPGKEGTNYFWPNAQSLDYWQSKGVTLVRVPFKWERLQPELNGPFDAEYLKRLKETIDLIAERKMVAALDMHNYNRYRGRVIGIEETSRAAYGQVWRELAKEFKGHPGVWGYGLMNEPYDSQGTWPANAQAAIDGIRSADKETMILVAGEHWSSTRSWRKYNENLHKEIKDPSDNLRYEGHFYFDRDSSGTYKASYEEEMAKADTPGQNDENVGVTRMEPFVAWLKEHNLKGFIGEFGVPAGTPNDDPRWMEAFERAVAYMKANDLPCTVWSAGTHWGKRNAYAVEPRDGQDTPQAKVLFKYNAK